MTLIKSTYTKIGISIKILFLSFIFISLPQGCTIKEGVPSADKNKMLSRAKEAYLISSGKHARPSVYNLNTALLIPDWNKKGFVVNSKGDNVLGVLAAQTDTSYTELNFIFLSDRVVMYIKDYTKKDNSLAIYSDIGEYIEKGSYNLDTKLYLKYATKASLSTVSRTMDGEYDGTTWLPEVTITYTPEPTLPPPASPTNTIPAPPVSYDPSTALPPAGTGPGGPGGNSGPTPPPNAGYVPVANANPPATPTKTIVPYGAPVNTTVGTVYFSYNGTAYIWDGDSWVQPLNEVVVKGSTPPPAKPANGTVFADYDPTTKIVTVYRYWDMIGSTPVNKWTTVYVPSLKEIIDNLKDPCLKNMLNLLKGKYFEDDVHFIIVKFNVSPYYNVNLGEYNDPAKSNTDAEEGKTENCCVDIDFNLAALGNASQEYIAATFYHEFLHSNLSAIDPKTFRDLQHDVMATKYVEPMAQALQKLFPNLSHDDAVALSWGGLGDTKAWTDMFNADKANGTSVTGNIAEINKKYKNLNNAYNGKFGTKCN